MGKQTPFNGCRTLPNPCHNPKTGDCPDRKAGCSRDCPKWQEHKKERAAMYEKRERLNMNVQNYLKARKTKGRDKYYGGGH